jgi:hypothetical protein
MPRLLLRNFYVVYVHNPDAHNNCKIITEIKNKEVSFLPIYCFIFGTPAYNTA